MPRRKRLVSRRHFLKSSLTLAGAVAAHPLLTTPKIAFAAAPSTGSTLTYGILPEFKDLDPNAFLGEESAARWSLFDNLVSILPDLKPRPVLAQSWKLAPDAMSLTFNLRRGVKFHNGREMTADDVIKNLERILDPKTGKSGSGSFATVAGGKALDKYTVVFNFKEPSPAFFGRLVWWQIIAPEAFPDAEKSTIATGPFKFVSWQPGDQMVIERFGDYWWPGKLNVGKVMYKFFRDNEAMVIAAEAGQLDMLYNVAPKDIKRLRAAGFDAGPPPVVVDYHILWLHPNRPPLDNVNLRQAIARAIDRDTILSTVLFGVGSTTTLPVPKPSPAWDAKLAKNWQFNLDEAKKFLDKSGLKNPEFTVYARSEIFDEQQVVQIIQQDLAKIGIKMNIEKIDEPSFNKRLVTADYQALKSFASAGIVDPVDYEDNSGYRFSKGILWGGPDKVPADFRAAFGKASATIDPMERAAAFKRVFQFLQDSAFAIPIAWRAFGVANKKNVRNVTYDAIVQTWWHDIVKG